MIQDNHLALFKATWFKQALIGIYRHKDCRVALISMQTNLHNFCYLAIDHSCSSRMHELW